MSALKILIITSLYINFQHAFCAEETITNPSEMSEIKMPPPVEIETVATRNEGPVLISNTAEQHPVAAGPVVSRADVNHFFDQLIASNPTQAQDYNQRKRNAHRTISALPLSMEVSGIQEILWAEARQERLNATISAAEYLQIPTRDAQRSAITEYYGILPYMRRYNADMNQCDTNMRYVKQPVIVGKVINIDLEQSIEDMVRINPAQAQHYEQRKIDLYRSANAARIRMLWIEALRSQIPPRAETDMELIGISRSMMQRLEAVSMYENHLEIMGAAQSPQIPVRNNPY